MESIIKSFSQHGTFVQPETLHYILAKENPEEYTSLITQHLKEFPLVLTLDHLRDIEDHLQENDNPREPSPELIETKQWQKQLLDKVYGGGAQQVLVEENDQDDEEIEKETTLEYPKKEPTSTISSPSFSGIGAKDWNPIAKEYEADIKIIRDITGKSTCEGTVGDFTKLFLDRFEIIRKILRRQRRELANTIPIKRIQTSGINEPQFIGIVKEIRTTTNGHRLVELEDDTGQVTAIALKNDREVFASAQEIVLDEIVGIRGQLSKHGDLIVIKNVIFPDISIQNHRHKADVPLCAAFLSDIHVGSKQFMEREWHSFLRWLNGDSGNKRQKDVAAKIKYLVIPGDVVDGIGIYPNQEEELSITDVYRQYEMLADQIRNIPGHITILMQPGNHDAVRPAEPQPTFEKEIRDLFTGMDIRFAGNPCYFSLHSIEILSYHGQSLLDFSTNIQHLKYNEPLEVMKQMLRKHHLAPTYGGYTPLAPEHSDYMVIDQVPDIFVTGHVHLASIGEYRGVTLINASSWQSQTSYQKMLNFIPEPAKLPIVNLKSGNVTIMDFNKQL
jgi:DNA polymerase II small subunit